LAQITGFLIGFGGCISCVRGALGAFVFVKRNGQQILTTKASTNWFQIVP
jgi:hypothetical protein